MHRIRPQHVTSVAPALVAALALLAGAVPAGAAAISGRAAAPPPAAKAEPRPALTDLVTIAPGLVNGSCPLPGVATAGQPAVADFARFRQAGYRTVVDFRRPEEARGFDEAAAVRAAGLDYVVIPVTAATVGDRQFDDFRRLMRDPARRPILVHCHSANRVGAMMYPYLVLDLGKPGREALAMAKRIGLRSPELERIAVRYVETHRAAAR